MIDPDNITIYNQKHTELEEVLLFWILAAGKNAKTSALGLEKLLTQLAEAQGAKTREPFSLIRNVKKEKLALMMKACGLGCFNNKATSFKDLVNSGIDLKTCTVDELEEIHGIGPKTARCFLIHSRKGVEYAGLDTHILKFLGEQGYEVGKSTPSSKKKYRELEQAFISIAKKSGKSIADFDLEIWKRGKNKTMVKA